MYRVGGTKPIHVDVRMLTASGHDLEALCERGSFRPDLYFRLNEYTISIPPLRERREDILYLAKRFLDIANIELSKSIKGFSPPAIEAMLAYRWPGNVRQLRSVVRRAVLMAEDIITEEHLGLRLKARELPAKDEPAEGVFLHARPGVGRSPAAGNRPAATRSTWSGWRSPRPCGERAETKPRPHASSRLITRPFIRK